MNLDQLEFKPEDMTRIIFDNPGRELETLNAILREKLLKADSRRDWVRKFLVITACLSLWGFLVFALSRMALL